jgi:hypothetical protein
MNICIYIAQGKFSIPNYFTHFTKNAVFYDFYTIRKLCRSLMTYALLSRVKKTNNIATAIVDRREHNYLKSVVKKFYALF